MAKISPISGKYIIQASIKIDGVVDRPDIIGAVFGQTEGLLGADLELRELQRSGRIGRIEVNTESKQGKTNGDIIIPSSLDKAETAIVGAALEVIERIGPCNAYIRVKSIEDIRVAKRTQVIERAKELLAMMQTTSSTDSAELAESVASSVRQMEISTWGPDKLPCGPDIESQEEIMVVEGRADVMNLLKYGFKNVISMNGSSIPKSLPQLLKGKIVTMFVDGDRGGILNIKEMMSIGKVDFVIKAPDGKEVEELQMKEIHKAMRSKVTPDQMKHELESKDSLRGRQQNNRPQQNDDSKRDDSKRPSQGRPPSKQDQELYKDMLDDLIGSHAASLVDKENNILGKVPISELESTLEGLDDVKTIIIDGKASRGVVNAAEKTRVQTIVCRESDVKKSRCTILTFE